MSHTCRNGRHLHILYIYCIKCADVSLNFQLLIAVPAVTSAGRVFGIVTSVAHHLLSISKCLSPPHLPQKRLLRDYHGKKQAAMGEVMEGHMAFDLAALLPYGLGAVGGARLRMGKLWDLSHYANSFFLGERNVNFV